MLFIPWLFQMLEGLDATEAQLRIQSRDLENNLADALKAGGESTGIIGRDAGRDLQRLPSSVYWAGLGSWGIRLFPGSIDSFFVSQRLHLRRSKASADGGADSRSLGSWSQTMPVAPSGLLDRAAFRLTTDEAQFIVDSLVSQHPTTLLTALARDGVDDECPFIWMHPHLRDFPAQALRIVRHGEAFSQVMQGAALLYNMSLSELRRDTDRAADYRERIRQWRAALDLSNIRHWSLDDFWDAVRHPAHSIRPAAKRFVIQWRELALGQATEFESNSPAGRLIEERERFLKGAQSRYANQAALTHWRGASGVDRFTFRWAQASSHVRDITHAE
jgi:hypothetical protein